MAVVGVDFGNLTCYISVARAGGIESIANDYSLRDTPSVVGFSDKQRIMGVGAKNQLLTNLKKTVFNFKHMLGRKFKDPYVQEAMKGLPYDISEGQQGEVRVHLNYMDKTRSFTPEEITAMLFTKLKDTAEEALKTKVKDIVISTPSYFVDSERRAILDAAAIAGLNVLKLMNDTTATALAYGIYKQDLPAPEEKARNVIFVDCGHVGVQVSAASFNKGKLTMKACTFDRSNCAGKAFDAKLVKYFAEEFKSKTKLDPFTNPRSILKLTTEVEKVKKQMSAGIAKYPLNIECFMEERDLSARVDRAAFEELITDELQIIEKVMVDCLKASEWKQEDIYAVEIVGGSSRVPAVKAAIERTFGKTPQTTLNADEAVSRGCALQCAILSPTFRVREFSVTDIQPYPIKLNWKAESDTGDMVVFPKFHQVPFSKILTFYRRDNFKIEAEYDGDVPVMNPLIGQFEIGDVKPLTDGGNQKVKVKVRINLHGVFVTSSANYTEKHEIEEEVQMEVDPPKEEANSAETSGSAPASEGNDKEPPKNEDAEMKEDDSSGAASPKAAEEPSKKEVKTEKRKKVISKTIDLPVTSIVVGVMSRDKLENALEQEKVLVNQDTYESNRLLAKNAVEEYIYSIREKISEELEPYILEAEREVYSRKLTETEDWLYEDGEDCEKAIYEEKHKELKLVGEAAKKRKSEYEGRKMAVDTLGHSLQMAAKVVELYKAGDEKYNHLTDAEVDKVSKLIEEKSQWLSSAIGQLERLPKHSNPSTLNCQFISEKDAFEQVCRPILNKAKPKAEPPKQEESKKEAADTTKAGTEENLKKGAEETGPMEQESAPVNGNSAGEQQQATGQQTMDLD
jgi:molecular chaperone DnaK (HSP70)